MKKSPRRDHRGGPKANDKGKDSKSSGGPGRHGPPRGAKPAARGLRPSPELHPRRDGARWVVGIHSCAESLKVRARSIREVWFKQDYESSEALRELAEQAAYHKIRIEVKSPGQLDQVGSGNQGVALATTTSPELDWGDLAAPGRKVILILDGLEDPHNLGSILRTAWLTGVSGILIPEDRAVGLTPAVCKIASGGAEHVPVEAHANIATEMQRLKDIGFWIYGLSEKGERKPWEFELPEKVAWVVGSEGGGMRITTERACDELVRIPQVATGSSYNAAIAASMALAETARQSGAPD